MTLPGGKKKVAAIGNYRFSGKVLGKGNFARVEEAVHSVLNVKVAIKIMDVNNIKEEYVIRNLYREAKIMSKLHHPCIAALFQTMQRSDNVYYLVSELVAGGDLCSFIKGQRNGKLDERSTKIYARQFVSALSHMHGMGIVHRDLKMENVMLNPSQTQIKIVDFGLSNVWSENSPLRTHCGSPEYAAPELFVTGREYGPEVDLWSLGIILYGMVVGQLPFVSTRNDHVSSQERRKRLVAQINKGLAAPHRRMIATHTPEFRSMMCKLLVADSAKRITIAELLVHPWITDKGTKTIRTNPLKKLDPLARNKICRDIGSLLEMDYEDVDYSVSEEPLGKVGGMFNILSYKLTRSLLNGDGVTRTLSQGFGVRPMTARRDYTQQKVATSRTDPKRTALKSAPPIKTESTYNRNPVTRAPPNRTNYKMVQEELPPRPKTVAVTSNTNRHPIVKKSLASATVKKSVNVASKERIKESVNVASKEKIRVSHLPVIDYNKIENIILNQLHITGTRGIPEALNLNKFSLEKIKAKNDTTSIKKLDAVSKETTAIDKSRSKSETVAGMKRPTTSPNPTLKKSIKHTSVSPVNYTHSAPKTAYKSTEKAPAKYQNLHMREKAPASTSEKAPQAGGDTSLSTTHRTTTGRTQQDMRKPLIYDPIARSIADYLANNVTDKIKHLKLPKHFQ